MREASKPPPKTVETRSGAEESGKAQNRALAQRVGMAPSGIPRTVGGISSRTPRTS